MRTCNLCGAEYEVSHACNTSGMSVRVTKAPDPVPNLRYCLTCQQQSLSDQIHICPGPPERLAMHMTIRERMAMAAMQGILANPNSVVANDDTVVEEAYKFADMMIEKGKECSPKQS